ncbi:MAG: hypothetical protein HWD59_00915 [Coxiellaceae bacterium]|nr:MAG: hypothetical protein HWD59_00915 [Coxiellaceae bacterium]
MPEFNDKTVYLLPQISSHLNFPFIKWIWNILGKWMWGELSSSNTMTTLANIVTYNDLTNQLFNGLIRSLPISILLNKAITQFEEEYKQSKKLDQTALCILWGIVVRQLSVQKPLYLTPTSAGLQVNLYFSDAEAPLVISVESAAYLELLIKMISERLQRSRYNLKCVPVNFWGDLDFNSLAKEFYAKSAKVKATFVNALISKKKLINPIICKKRFRRNRLSNHHRKG